MKPRTSKIKHTLPNMIDISPITLIIIVNVNGLNTPIKKLMS